MHEKFSSAQVDQLLVKSASAIRTLVSRVAILENEKAVRDRQDHAEKIAHAAVERGMMDADEADDYAEKLASGADDLKVVEDFVGRAAAGMPLGKMHEKTASEDHGESGDGQDALTRFLLNSEDVG